MSFEPIGEAAKRVVYSCAEEIMSQRERVEAWERAKSDTRKAINHEWSMKKRAQDARNGAIKGNLHALAFFISLADQYDEAARARRACERLEANWRQAVELGEQGLAPQFNGRSVALRPN